MEGKYYIVGIDPGATTAVVLLSLDKKTYKYKAEKHMGEERVISFISKHGKPSLIATDVNPPPDFVLKISAILDAPIFYPSQSLTKKEKDSLGKHIKNPHIRDAYAAALKAYNHFSNTLRKIDKKYNKKEAEEYKHHYLRGKRLHDLSTTNKIKHRFKKSRY